MKGCVVENSDKGSDKGRRDGALTTAEVRQLLQRSAGLCEFENCAKPLFYDLVSGETCNDGQYAHIIPSSAGGPRGGGNESEEYIASVDNRMHLCHAHHELVDSHPDEYPADRLREMKAHHEECVLAFRQMLVKTPILPIVFEAKIKNTHEVVISASDVVQAVKDEERPLAREMPKRIKIESSADYASPRYWEETVQSVRRKVDDLMEEYKALGAGQVECGIFPLAPIPLIAMLGFLIGDKLPVRSYQLLRDESHWSWKRDSKANTLKWQTLRDGSMTANRVAVAVSLSAEISSSVLASENDETVPVFEIRADRIGVDSISKREDLKTLRNAYHAAIGEIQSRYESSAEVYMYLAVPVSAAYEIGRRYMPSVFPKIHIMENVGDGKWLDACTIG